MIRGSPLQGGSRGSICYEKQMLSGSQANEPVKKKLSQKGERVLSPKAGRNLEA